MLTIEQKRQFSICLDTYVIRDKDCIGYSCKKDNLDEKIAIAIEAGYSGVELWHPDVIKFKQARGSLNSLPKCRVPSYKVLSNIFTSKFNPEECSRLLEDAQTVGAKSVVVKLIDDNYRGAIPNLNDVCTQYDLLLKLCEKFNIRPSLEFMSLSRGFNTLESICEILKRVDNPRAALVLDTFHLWRKGDRNFSTIDFSMVRPEWVSVVHFTDTSKVIPQHQQGDGHRKLPGEGLLNLSRFLSLLGGINYTGVLSLNVYDRSLWDRPPMEVAIDGLHRTNRLIFAEEFQDTKDAPNWRGREDIRCDGLWSKDYFTHLDPRFITTNRAQQIERIVLPVIAGKKVLDFKCGFSPLSSHVSVGFDAYQGCIDYLRRKHPAASWHCMSDEGFSQVYKDKIDVLMHIGLGDSDTEVASSLLVRENCKPEIVILECCANDDGTVNNAKAGSSERWEKLKHGLTGDSYVIKTDLPKRSTRLLFIGRT